MTLAGNANSAICMFLIQTDTGAVPLRTFSKKTPAKPDIAQAQHEAENPGNVTFPVGHKKINMYLLKDFV